MGTRHNMSRRNWMAASVGGAAMGMAASAEADDLGAATTANRSIRFAHLTDIHVQEPARAAEGMEAALQHAHEQDDPPEWIVFGGDNVMNVDSPLGAIASQQQLDVFTRVRDSHCRLPYATAIGNHDVLGMQQDSGKKWAMDGFGLDARFYAVDRAGWRFVVLDSTEPQEGGGYKGRLDDEQFEWFEGLLHATPKTTNVCVISHIPIFGPCAFFDGDNEKTGDWVVPGAWMHIDARRIKNLFRRHQNVRLCLSGHIHLADTATYLGVTYACNGAVCGGWWGGPYQEFEPAYAMVDLFDDGTSAIELIEYGWEARTA